MAPRPKKPDLRDRRLDLRHAGGVALVQRGRSRPEVAERARQSVLRPKGRGESMLVRRVDVIEAG
jgi:hypothetical protein